MKQSSKLQLLLILLFTVYYGENSIMYFGLYISNEIPNKIRKIRNFNKFKAAIRKWKPSHCLTLLCKNPQGDVILFIKISDGNR